MTFRLWEKLGVLLVQRPDETLLQLIFGRTSYKMKRAPASAALHCRVRSHVPFSVSTRSSAPPLLGNGFARESCAWSSPSSGRKSQPLPVSSISPSSRGKSSTFSELNKTILYDFHVRNGGKMVPFAGYLMPVQYTDLGVGDSHRWTREKASLFDVGHMFVQPVLQLPKTRRCN